MGQTLPHHSKRGCLSTQGTNVLTPSTSEQGREAGPGPTKHWTGTSLSQRVREQQVQVEGWHSRCPFGKGGSEHG
jgi:hypothetical protein